MTLLWHQHHFNIVANTFASPNTDDGISMKKIAHEEQETNFHYFQVAQLYSLGGRISLNGPKG